MRETHARAEFLSRRLGNVEQIDCIAAISPERIEDRFAGDGIEASAGQVLEMQRAIAIDLRIPEPGFEVAPAAASTDSASALASSASTVANTLGNACYSRPRLGFESLAMCWFPRDCADRRRRSSTCIRMAAPGLDTARTAGASKTIVGIMAPAPIAPPNFKNCRLVNIGLSPRVVFQPHDPLTSAVHQ